VKEKIEEIGTTMDRLLIADDEDACIARMNEVAHEIADLAIENFRGVLLRRALDIVAAIVEFASEFEGD
jgi:hypothetical protein